ncbi:hypothetical protein INT47_006502 [Mucor saturninus]|uniref:Uncharacterized protein n=1 Tax=Mucor saturninus TaxID=64648 RepID=A0A8H7QR61_9FUNG|nr:hypothetical protein INT47_006502 [Mucor saturninus]
MNVLLKKNRSCPHHCYHFPPSRYTTPQEVAPASVATLEAAGDSCAVSPSPISCPSRFPISSPSLQASINSNRNYQAHRVEETELTLLTKDSLIKQLEFLRHVPGQTFQSFQPQKYSQPALIKLLCNMEIVNSNCQQAYFFQCGQDLIVLLHTLSRN